MGSVFLFFPYFCDDAYMNIYKKFTGIFLENILIWIGMLESGVTHFQNLVQIVTMGICWMFSF